MNPKDVLPDSIDANPFWGFGFGVSGVGFRVYGFADPGF